MFDVQISAISIPGVIDNRLPAQRAPVPSSSSYDSSRRKDSISKRKPEFDDDLPASQMINDATSPALKPRKPSVSHPEAEAYADDFDGEDRPIRPKSEQEYNDADPDVGDDFNENIREEQFPRGHHPLEGIDHFKDLPTPEELTIKSRWECMSI